MEDEKRVRKSKKRKGKFKKIILSLLTFIVFGIIFTVLFSFNVLGRIKGNEVAPVQVGLNKPVNILILGVDAGDLESKSKNSPKRSDTMMLLRYNPESDQAYILSLPRDTRVKVNGGYHKLNAAHAIGGVPMTIKTIENLMGIQINYFAKIDYAGFRECIDAIGGVDVTIPQDMDYDAQDIKIHFKKGETVHLDGEKAEQFVRWRKNNNGDGYKMGDLGRISTQQEFIIKVIEKVKTPSGLIRLPKLIDAISKYVTTNIDSKKMMELIVGLKSINTNSIDKRLLEGSPKEIGGVSYFIYDKEKSKEYLSNFIDSEISVGLKNKDISKEEISITILNSTGISGLASRYKTKLESLGYSVVETGNYSKKLQATLIKDYSKEDAGKELCSDLGFGEVTEFSDKNKSDIVIILGTDSTK